jgi:hypothetical protein
MSADDPRHPDNLRDGKDDLILLVVIFMTGLLGLCEAFFGILT